MAKNTKAGPARAEKVKKAGAPASKAGTSNVKASKAKAAGTKTTKARASATKTPTVREMTRRVSRYQALKPQPWIFIDFALPEGERDILAIIGHGVKDRESLAVPPHIQDVGSFHMAMIRCKPGKGASLHAHETEEVFMCLDGQWSVFWGDKGEKEVVLDRYDTVSVPAGVMRGFRNVGRKEGHLLGVLGGSDPGMLTWSPRVLAAAKARGYELDPEGYIRKAD